MNLSPRSPRSEQSISENISSSSTTYPSDFEVDCSEILERGRVSAAKFKSIGNICISAEKSKKKTKETAPWGFFFNLLNRNDHKKIYISNEQSEPIEPPVAKPGTIYKPRFGN
jgi:hypothetical protein